VEVDQFTDLTRKNNAGRLSFELWPLVVTDGRVVGAQGENDFDLFRTNLGPRCRAGLPQDFSPDREVPALLPGEVARDQFVVCAPEIVDAVGNVLTDIDLSVWIGNLVNGLDLARFGHGSDYLTTQ
jgi:hypothetical protein